MYASWLNQVEIWLSVPTSKSLKGTSFGSANELIVHIGRLIESYNESFAV